MAVLIELAFLSRVIIVGLWACLGRSKLYYIFLASADYNIVQPGSSLVSNCNIELEWKVLFSCEMVHEIKIVSLEKDLFLAIEYCSRFQQKNGTNFDHFAQMVANKMKPR